MNRSEIPENTKSYGVLVDIPMCVGCESCSVACKLWNQLAWHEEQKLKTARERAQEPNKGLWADEWTSINQYDLKKDGTTAWRFAKAQCFHCQEPACVSACFTKALQKLPQGPVIYDQNLCVGCRYCMLACPFDVIKFQWEKAIPGIRKCQMCATRVANNISPACEAVCPTGALTFGERQDLLIEAEKRIKEKGYIDHIFGQKEVGGTSWLYISDVPFDQMRFRTDVTTRPMPSYSEGFLKTTPVIGLGWAAILAGLYIYNNKGKEPLE